MSSTAKNTLIVVVIVIVLIALFFAFKQTDQSATVDNNATSTSNTSSGANSGGSAATPNSLATVSTINNDATLNAMMNSTVVRVPNTGIDVMMTNGSATFTNGTIKGTVTRGRILGKIPTDDGYDVFTTMTITTANSSSSLEYIALFKVLNSKVTYTSAVVVGDRLTIQSIAASADVNAPIKPPQQYFDSNTTYNLAINYLDRKNGEPMTATPTLQKTLNARVKNHLVTR